MRKILLAVFVSSCMLYGGVGVDSLNFLKIKPSARGASLSDGFASVRGDVNAAFYNPASLTSINDLQISLMHLAYVSDTSFEFLTFAMPLSKNITLGLSVSYMSYGAIAFTSEDSFGVYVAGSGAFSPYDLAGVVSLGIKLNKNTSLGINAKYAMEDISGSSASAFLADAGILAGDDAFSAGASIYNIGAGVKEDRAPMGIRGGVSKTIELMKDGELMLVLGGNYAIYSAKLTESIGAEYSFEKTLTVRGSYTLGDDTNNINAGAGFKGNMDGVNYGVDYNFSLLGDMGSAHRISLTLSFGETTGSSKKRTNSNNKLRYFMPKGR